MTCIYEFIALTRKWRGSTSTYDSSESNRAMIHLIFRLDSQVHAIFLLFSSMPHRPVCDSRNKKQIRRNILVRSDQLLFRPPSHAPILFRSYLRMYALLELLKIPTDAILHIEILLLKDFGVYFVFFLKNFDRGLRRHFFLSRSELFEVRPFALIRHFSKLNNRRKLFS